MDDKNKVKLYRLVSNHEFLTEEIELDEVIKLIDKSTTPIHIYESVTLWVGEDPLYKTFFDIEDQDELEELIMRAENKVENEGYLHNDGVVFTIEERDVDPAMEDYNYMIGEWAAKWVKPYDVNKLWKKSDLLLPGNRCHNCEYRHCYNTMSMCYEYKKGTPVVSSNFTCEKWEEQ